MIIGKSLTALGGGGLKPEIRVTAQAGALLNLHYKDSSIILKSYQLGAEETQHTFVVDVSETAYVVEDVTNGASVEVLVDAVAQYNAEIMYVLWLYRDGDECEDVTGGWTGKNVEGNNTFRKDSDNLYIALAGTSRGVTINTNNMINLTGYTKLYAECICELGDAFFGLANYIMKDRSGSERYKIGWGESTKKVLSIDFDTTESKYAYIGTISSSTYVSNSIRLYKMWLE